jgi:hypothetical protein
LQILRIFRELNVTLTHERHQIYYEHLLRAISTRALSVDFMSVFIEDKLQNKMSNLTLGDWFAAEIVQRFWRRNERLIKAFSAERASAFASVVAQHDRALLSRVVALLEKQQVVHDLLHMRRQSFSAEQLSHWDAMHRTLGPAHVGHTAMSMEDVLSSSTLSNLFSIFCHEQGDPPENMQFILELQLLEHVRSSYCPKLSPSNCRHRRRVVRLIQC